MNIQPLVFYVFAIILLISGVMVITSRNPVRGALFLVLAFFASSVIWMLLQAEFLALVLIFVYVGAVMTLFLFVVMMLNIDTAPLRAGFVRYLPLGILVIVLLVGLMILAINPKHFNGAGYQAINQPADYSNVKELGNILYTQYLYPFEIAAVLLLVAIISAISLAFRGRRDRKTQTMAEQANVNPADRIRIVKMPSEKTRD
jgi:NADH-quinone oxidoreductase subunit J